MDIWTILRAHEGVRVRVYCDLCGEGIRLVVAHWECGCSDNQVTAGYMTIGVGHNLDAAPLTDVQINTLLADDLGTIEAQLTKLDWYNKLDTNRQWAIVDLAFAMGVGGLLEFTTMIRWLTSGALELAADALLLSKFAEKNPRRAADDAVAIRTGKWSAL